MGSKNSVFTEKELEEYEELTFLTKNEILIAWKNWEQLVGETHSNDFTKRFPNSTVKELPHLKNNPFGDQLLRVFSSQEDDQMSFEDFLDMISIMSAKSTFQLKVHYAFKVYDVNGDGILDSDDLNAIVDLLTDKKLDQQSQNMMIERLLKEIDLDGAGISSDEFEHFMMKCPDFVHTFRFSI